VREFIVVRKMTESPEIVSWNLREQDGCSCVLWTLSRVCGFAGRVVMESQSRAEIPFFNGTLLRMQAFEAQDGVFSRGH